VKIVAWGDSTVLMIQGPCTYQESWEYLLMRDALGQTMTVSDYGYDGQYPTIPRTYTGADYTMVNRGIGGWTTAWMLRDLAAYVLVHDPDYVIILGGANDGGYYEGITSATAANNIIATAQACVAAGAVPVLCTCPGVTGSGHSTWFADFNARLSTAAASNGWTIADVYSAIRNPDFSLKSGTTTDGTHFTVTGSAAVATKFTAAMFPALAPTLTATAGSDHITLTWPDTATGEDGWYVERRVAG